MEKYHKITIPFVSHPLVEEYKAKLKLVMDTKEH